MMTTIILSFLTVALLVALLASLVATNKKLDCLDTQAKASKMLADEYKSKLDAKSLELETIKESKRIADLTYVYEKRKHMLDEAGKLSRVIFPGSICKFLVDPEHLLSDQIIRCALSNGNETLNVEFVFDEIGKCLSVNPIKDSNEEKISEAILMKPKMKPKRKAKEAKVENVSTTTRSRVRKWTKEKCVEYISSNSSMFEELNQSGISDESYLIKIPFSKLPSSDDNFLELLAQAMMEDFDYTNVIIERDKQRLVASLPL